MKAVVEIDRVRFHGKFRVINSNYHNEFNLNKATVCALLGCELLRYEARASTTKSCCSLYGCLKITV